MLPALRRVPQIRGLIDQETYFVVHAPRQVGKTTSLMSLGVDLTREGRYTALLVSMAVGEPFRGDPHDRGRGGKDPRPAGLRQLDGYLAGLGLDSGWLIIFAQRVGLPPIEERTRSEIAASPGGRRATVICA